MLCACEHQSDGLDGLAESHIVCEACTGSPFGETGHPLVAFHLVVAKRGLQTFGQSNLHGLGVCYFLEQGTDTVVRMQYAVAVLQQFAQQTNLHAWNDSFLSGELHQAAYHLQLFGKLFAESYKLVVVEPYETFAYRILPHQTKQVGSGNHVAFFQLQTAFHFKPVLLCLQF